MDGLLIDSEPQWFRAESAVAASYGGTWTHDDQRACHGTMIDRTADYIRRHVRTDDAMPVVRAHLFAAIATELRLEVRLRPGAAALLADLERAGVPCALVSSTYRQLLDIALQGLGPRYFAVTVAGDEVAHGKPHPDPYLDAARQLGVDPGRCVALEDSLIGVASAEAAGCMVVAVPDLTQVPPAAGRRVVDSLRDVDTQWLEHLAATWEVPPSADCPKRDSAL